MGYGIREASLLARSRQQDVSGRSRAADQRRPAGFLRLAKGQSRAGQRILAWVSVSNGKDVVCHESVSSLTSSNALLPWLFYGEVPTLVPAG